MRGKWDSVRLTRREAIRAEIDTSIALFLGHSDHVSAHLLAWAATETLRGLAREARKETFQAILEDRIKSEHLKEWRELLKKTYNFAKHADRDPHLEIEDFRPESTSFTIFGSCHDYKLLFGQKSWSMFVFQSWFHCRNPTLVIEPMKSILPLVQSSFGSPETATFRESTREALEILIEGKRNPTVVKRQMTESWRNSIEW